MKSIRMTSRSCIIIHQSPIVQNGLSTILHSINLEVREILLDTSDCKVLKEWVDFIVLIDVIHWNFIQKHKKYLVKGKNSIIGLDFTDLHTNDYNLFDEVIHKSDSQTFIFNKLKKFIVVNDPKGPSNQLSSREQEILRLIAQGNSNRLIAEKLFISIHTVITHRKHITGKLGIKSISGLTLYAAINNIID